MSIKKYKDEIHYNSNLEEYCESIMCLFQNKQVKFNRYSIIMKKFVTNFELSKTSMDYDVTLMLLTVYDSTAIAVIEDIILRPRKYLIIVCENQVAYSIRLHVSGKLYNNVYVKVINTSMLRKIHSKGYEKSLIKELSSTIDEYCNLVKTEVIRLYFNKQCTTFVVPDSSNSGYFFTNKYDQYDRNIFTKSVLICYLYALLSIICAREYKNYYESICTIKKMNIVARREMKKIINNKFFSICAKTHFVQR